MVRQNADRDCFEGITLLHDFVDVPKAADFFDQEVTRPAREDDCEEENAAFGADVLRH